MGYRGVYLVSRRCTLSNANCNAHKATSLILERSCWLILVTYYHFSPLRPFSNRCRSEKQMTKRERKTKGPSFLKYEYQKHLSRNATHRDT